MHTHARAYTRTRIHTHTHTRTHIHATSIYLSHMPNFIYNNALQLITTAAIINFINFLCRYPQKLHITNTNYILR